MVLCSGRKCVVSDTLNPKLVPHVDKVVAFIELDLVGDLSSAVLFVSGVLEIPTTLVLLDELGERLLVGAGDALLHYAPDLEVLGGIAGLILGGSLPCYNEGALWREAQLVDVEKRETQRFGTSVGIDYGDGLRRGPTEEPTTWGVSTAP